MDSRPSMLTSAAIGGSVFGLLAGLPLVGALNCACCALVIGGGFFAGWLYSRACAGVGAAFSPGNGALLGLTAAPFYALVSSILSAVFRSVSPEQIEKMVDQLEQTNVPPEWVERIARFVEGGAGPIGWFIGFLVGLAIAAVFSTIGGLIAGAVFKVQPPAAQSSPPPAAE